jgi:hypothetical protein
MFAIIIMSVFSAVAFGQDFPLPPETDLAALFELIRDYKNFTPIAGGMVLITVLVQLLKAVSFKYSRVAVVVLSVLYSVLLSVKGGISWLDASVSVLIVGGGATAIYHAWKDIKKLMGISGDSKMGEESSESK